MSSSGIFCVRPKFRGGAGQGDIIWMESPLKISMSGISSEIDGDAGGENLSAANPISSSSSSLEMSTNGIASLFPVGRYVGDVGLTAGKITREQDSTLAGDM